MDYPTIAGSDLQTPPSIKQLFAGEAPIMSDSSVALATITQYQLCALTSTGITPFVSGTHTGPQAVVAGIGGATNARIGYYDAGKFLHEAITWPAGVTTLAARKALVQGSMIKVGHLLVPPV